ncbi:UNVERIFIED_CONTAM: hypothetical protein Scaly_0548200 [Sesamum calycinum]|uniref:Flotillin-like n=1 Tax=Sesamum calycinum TaxID=2727403 RepID=A0AAW2RR72_9LAMI
MLWNTKNNAHKVQEAKAAADRFEGLAIQKRQRAQMLMENADLATYKAVMALRIAEAAQISEAPVDLHGFLTPLVTVLSSEISNRSFAYVGLRAMSILSCLICMMILSSLVDD